MQQKNKIQVIKETIEPVKGVLLFLVALFTANFLWKLLIWGDDGSEQVLLCNRWDISAVFNVMAVHITDVVRAMLRLCGISFSFRADNDIIFSPQNAIGIIWGCTAVKQSFIFTCIMLVARGSRFRKLWYIPLGLIAVYLFNIFRIVLIALITSQKPEYFVILHEYILKYIFYGFIFLIWVLWEEKIGKTQ